jgi:signal transduction histidine kinase
MRTGSLRTTALALILGALVGALVLADAWLLFANRSALDADAPFLFGMFAATSVTYAVSGILILRQRSSNPIGWLCLWVALALIAGLPMTEYGVHALVVDPGSLPRPDLVLAFAEPTPGLATTGIVLLLFLFPTGRPTSGAMRIAFITTVTAIAVLAAAVLLTPGRILDVWAGRLSTLGISVDKPLGVSPMRTVGPVLIRASGAVVAVGAVLAVTSLLLRRRRAGSEERAQLRWLTYVIGTAAAWIVVMLPLAFVLGEDSAVTQLFWIVATPLVSLGPPIAIGIAIVKHRLYDIDLVISKTVVYGALAAFITLVYFAIVVGVGRLIGQGDRPNVALSIVATAVVALAFQPVRERARRIANRLVYGDRATPYQALSDFSERIGETYATEDLLPRMVHILAQATGALQADVWVLDAGRLRSDASWPPDGAAAEAVAVAWDGEGRLNIPQTDLAVPVRHRGDLLGALSIRKAASDPVTPAERKLVEDLAGQAGLVIRNVRLIEELRESRRRIVTAQDERAKTLERNLHDGAQQQLVALAVKQRLADSLIERDPEKARAMMAEIQTDTTAALENLRDLARGIYPPLLADKGLTVALEAQARKAALPTEVRSDGVGRHPQDIEAAVYFCTLEALNNVAKYSRGTAAEVRLVQSGGELTFQVIDDGAGFLLAETGYGTGLQGMADRMDAIGGTLEVRSEPGAGTTVTGRIPASRSSPGPDLASAEVETSGNEPLRSRPLGRVDDLDLLSGPGSTPRTEVRPLTPGESGGSTSFDPSY